MALKTYRLTDELTRREFDSYCIIPSYIGAEEASVKAEYFGEVYDSPVMISTLSGLDNVGLSKAAVMTNTLDCNGVMPVETGLAILETGVPVILSSKPLADLDRILEMIRLYAEHGAKGFVMDADFIFDNTSGYYRNHEKFGQMGRKTIDDLKAMVNASSLPIIVKGILGVPDALACKEAGVKGIVVSHHMGVMETAVPPLRMIPLIRQAVGDDMYIFADCGIRSGCDVFKALALGADGALVGRPLVEAFAKGPEAAAEILDRYTNELRYYMSITGSKDIKHINREAVMKL